MALKYIIFAIFSDEYLINFHWFQTDEDGFTVLNQVKQNDKNPLMDPLTPIKDCSRAQKNDYSYMWMK